MKLKAILSSITVLAIATACNCGTDYTEFVDPVIGTGDHGHVFYGAGVPFGGVQLGPTSVPTAWDWCSGYHASDSSVIGFSHTRVCGSGIGDLFDVTVMPVCGETQYSRSGIAAHILRSKEYCEPGYYRAEMDRYNVKVELTAAKRVGFHKYEFAAPAGDNSIVFDLAHGGCYDRVTGSEIRIIDSTRICGFRRSTGWAKDQVQYFFAEFSLPFAKAENVAEHYWRFYFPGETKINLKVALSPTSAEAACENLAAEVPHWNFNAVRKAAKAAWNKELSCVEIETSDETARTIFYTAMYHAMTEPMLFDDEADSTSTYTVLSLWDTYRAEMPMLTILKPGMQNDFANTFLKIYDKQGKLPVWHLAGNETNTMPGNSGIPVLADIILKGFDGFDMEKAYEALKVSSMCPERGQDLRMKYGYIPADIFRASVAYDMEYSLDDWAMAQVARRLGKDEDYEYFLERSHSYRRHFDKNTGFMRGVRLDGTFTEPFNPIYTDHHVTDYCEGNAWQYIWLAPHDFQGLCDCFGSREELLVKLDSLFVVSSDLAGDNVSPDVSGLIGQYAHGNEPSHHIVYFYTMAGQPWKTADLVRRICSELYSAAPAGVCGNEDCGQMSAWYILSAMGFYQVEPAGGRYYFGSPLFDKVTIHLESGRDFVIEAPGNSADNKYIQRIYLNNRPYTKPYIDYKDIMAGGVLRIEMGSTPKLWYCADEPQKYCDQRPAPQNRLFLNPTIESVIASVTGQLT
ncbi:MAG: GH92 family glycosyl hydrolase [Bacteroidales bacterium]|nr:GH92 family glycosyl hydrolase [Bacteroidales bacterium]